MRRDLALLRAAGLTRARFSARFNKITDRGIVVLEDVFSPIGGPNHAYVRPGHWRGPLPQSGKQVEFLASIQPYWHDNGEQDLGLFDLRVIE